MINLKTLIIVAVIIVLASSPFLYFSYRRKKDENDEELKKYSEEQKGTFNWLMSFYKDIIADENQKQYRKPTDITTKKLQISATGTLEGLKVKELISKEQAQAMSNGHDWARDILIQAIEKNRSFRENVIVNLNYLEHEKYGYDVVNTVY